MVAASSELPQQTAVTHSPQISRTELRSDATVLLQAVGYCKSEPGKAPSAQPD